MATKSTTECDNCGKVREVRKSPREMEKDKGRAQLQTFMSAPTPWWEANLMIPVKGPTFVDACSEDCLIAAITKAVRE